MFSISVKLINYFIFLFKDLFSPIKTIIRYSHVTLQGNVIINNSIISNHVKVYHKTKISNSNINSFTYVGSNSKIMNANIGKFCSIASDVKIGLGIHPTNFISTYPGFYSNSASGSERFHFCNSVIEHQIINIGNDVWIGDGAKIVDGVTIGNGVIIAGGSFVTKDVPNYAIVGGIPAKIIKYRFSEKQISDLMNIKWWDNNIDYIKDKAPLFLNVSKFFNEFY